MSNSSITKVLCLLHLRRGYPHSLIYFERKPTNKKGHCHSLSCKLFPAVITFSSDTKVISVCSLITGTISLKLSLALGLLRKTSRTGFGMFSKPVIGDVGSVIQCVFGTWPSTFARVGDMSTICSGVAVIGSTTGPFWTPSTLCSPVPSGECSSCPRVGLSMPFS